MACRPEVSLSWADAVIAAAESCVEMHPRAESLRALSCPRHIYIIGDDRVQVIRQIGGSGQRPRATAIVHLSSLPEASFAVVRGNEDSSYAERTILKTAPVHVSNIQSTRKVTWEAHITYAIPADPSPAPLVDNQAKSRYNHPSNSRYRLSVVQRGGYRCSFPSSFRPSTRPRTLSAPSLPPGETTPPKR